MPRQKSSSRSSEINRNMDGINSEISRTGSHIGRLNDRIVTIMRKSHASTTSSDNENIQKYEIAIEKHKSDLLMLEQDLVILQGEQWLRAKKKAEIERAILKIQKIVRGKQARDKLNQSSSSLKESHVSEDSSSRDSGNRRTHTRRAKHLRGYMAHNKQHYDRVVRQLREGVVSLEGDKLPKLKYRKELGDGHCFFYAVRTNLHRIGLLGGYYEQKEPMIRERLVKELSKYTDRARYMEHLDRGFWDIIKDYETNYFPLEVDGITSWDNYKERLLAEEGTEAMWGGPLELYLISLAYNVNVYFFKYKPRVTGAEPSVIVEKIGKNVGLKKSRGKKRSVYLWHHDTPSDYEKGSAHWATLDPIKSGSRKTLKKKRSSSSRRSSSSSDKGAGAFPKKSKYKKSGQTKKKLGKKIKK